MNNSNTQALVTLNRSKNSLVYDINEKSIFSPSGLKLLQSHASKGFVKCTKSSINGKIRLTYDVSSFSTLQDAMANIYSKQYLAVIYNVLSIVLDLRNMDLMHRENISLNPRDIFIDKQTFKAYFIYLPVERESSPSAHIIFEKNVRELLGNFVLKNPEGMSSFTVQTCRELMDFRINTQEILNKLQTEGVTTATSETVSKPATSESGKIGFSKTGGLKPPSTVDTTPKPTVERPATPTKDRLLQKKEEPVPAEREINDLLRSMSQKSYNSTNPNNQAKVEKKVKKEKKKMKKETASVLIFFSCYIPILVVALFVIFNYYRNSGMNGTFIFFIIAVFMFVFMAPVIFFSRKNKKEEEETIYEPFVPSSRAGFRPFAIVGVSNAVTMEFFINKKEYIIGKMPDCVDGTIPFDKTVSDTHCKIVWDNGWFIQDLNSDYGTFVDEIRIVPGQKFPLKEGSKIKISKNYFEVKMF